MESPCFLLDLKLKEPCNKFIARLFIVFKNEFSILLFSDHEFFKATVPLSIRQTDQVSA
jgi:hypothetical protein